MAQFNGLGRPFSSHRSPIPLPCTCPRGPDHWTKDSDKMGGGYFERASRHVMRKEESFRKGMRAARLCAGQRTPRHSSSTNTRPAFALLMRPCTRVQARAARDSQNLCNSSQSSQGWAFEAGQWQNLRLFPTGWDGGAGVAALTSQDRDLWAAQRQGTARSPPPLHFLPYLPNRSPVSLPCAADANLPSHKLFSSISAVGVSAAGVVQTC